MSEKSFRILKEIVNIQVIFVFSSSNYESDARKTSPMEQLGPLNQSVESIHRLNSHN